MAKVKTKKVAVRSVTIRLPLPLVDRLTVHAFMNRRSLTKEIQCRLERSR